MKEIKIGKRKIGPSEPTYFIADIAANHDGDLKRAKALIKLAKEAGAEAAKFQHHNVKKYVSDYGFRSLGSKFSHQKRWKKSIFEVYKDAQIPINWTEELSLFCKEIGIDFLSTPYDLDMVDHLEKYNVPAYKIGSGDVVWHEMLEKVAKKGKLVIISTGAATIGEVQESIKFLKCINPNIALLQCNTNYTASKENFKYINLNVLTTYKTMFPDVVLGLSDHTLGHTTVIGAVSLGARIIEKHFTDDNDREGPDHYFSMNPYTWYDMVENTRILELALGNFTKEVQKNEMETVILQRRSIRVIKDMSEGEVITRENIEFQRPAPVGSFNPNMINDLLGKTIKTRIVAGDRLRNKHINW